VNDGIDAFERGQYFGDAVTDVRDGSREAFDFASAERGYIVVLGELSTGESADETAHACYEDFSGKARL
jgi:hypothetical protein